MLHIYDTCKERIPNPDSLRVELQALTDFLCSYKIEVLNVAGPRESNIPDGRRNTGERQVCYYSDPREAAVSWFRAA